MAHCKANSSKNGLFKFHPHLCIHDLFYLLPKTFKLFSFQIFWPLAYLIKVISETCCAHLIIYLRYYYHWVDTSAGCLLVPYDIHPVVSISEQTCHKYGVKSWSWARKGTKCAYDKYIRGHLRRWYNLLLRRRRRWYTFLLLRIRLSCSMLISFMSQHDIFPCKC
jgi:hypothetical protein